MRRVPGTQSIFLVLVSRTWNGKRSLKNRGYFFTKADAKVRLSELRDLSDADYRICNRKELTLLKTEIKSEQDIRRKKGAVKAAATRKKRGPNNFVRCPTCNAKSKKLFSEMGGLQTRRCQNGHNFEKDMYMDGIMPARRVENVDRPIFTGIPYNDYVYGRFKNDPTGKGG